LIPNQTNHPALEIFGELLSVPAPSGNEQKVAAIVKQRIESMGYLPEIDPAGNVFVRIEGQDPDAATCIFAAHIDEIGFVVHQIQPDGSLSIGRTGGLHPWKIGERPVEILGDQQTIIGVTSLGAGHGAAADTVIKWKDVRILTGLSPDQLAEAGVRPGSCGVPLRSTCGPVVFGDNEDPLVAAWTFDDRMGAVALLRLLETIKEESLTPFHPTILAFTTQEEVGGQGAKTLANREKPEIFIAVDGCPIPPGSHMKLDGRPGIWSMDRLGHYDQELVRFFIQSALDAGTELQVAVYDSTASDASMVYAAGGTSRAAVLGHVRENSHGYEVARMSVFDNLLSVLVQFIKTWKAQ
jgi:putative aminopeptidase FrvX